MLFHPIDVKRLCRDIVSAAEECRDLKRSLRRTWTREMADEQRRLARVSWHVTELYILRARLRGKWHVTAVPRALRGSGDAWDREVFHAKIAERVARDYAMTGTGEAA